MGESSYLAVRPGGRDAGCEVVHIPGVGRYPVPPSRPRTRREAASRHQAGLRGFSYIGAGVGRRGRRYTRPAPLPIRTG